ncbi:6-pyruvoyl-tetrahydropterin synthase, isoform CRA_b, partial [Dimargaris cristalligena]
QVNETTGMVINISHLKECIQVAIMDPLDHQNLDRDVPFFHQRPSTTENLVLFIWQNVQAFLGPGWLYRIKLYETDLNFVEYFGDEV